MIISLNCKNEIIEDVYIADTFIKRFKGYMFQKKSIHKAILIKPCNSIHTFFMKFNIDVLFLDKNMVVVKKIENLNSNRVIMPIKEVVMVLEGEVGLYKNILIGDRISFLSYEAIKHS